MSSFIGSSYSLCGDTVVVGDFDGDKFTDLAIGCPHAGYVSEVMEIFCLFSVGRSV